MMASFGPTLILLAIVTGSTFSATVEEDESDNATSGVGVRMLGTKHMGYMADNDKLATIWLSSPEDQVDHYVFRCTGTVISPQLVVTAATCASDGKGQNTLFISNAKGHLTEKRSFTPVLNISVNNELDLAVLRVNDSYFNSPNLHKLLGKNIHVPTDAKCRVCGWLPSSDKWAYDDVLFLDNEECSFAYNDLSTPFNKNHVCTEVGNTTCTIGLGWSLICDDQVTGVFTWTHHSCKKPSVYASIETALPWLESFHTGAASGNIASIVLTVVAALVWTTL